MPAERFGKYLVRGMLGQGGMGAVFLGWDPDLEREVAIKLIVPQRLGSSNARSRFVREARALARLADPHVVQVYAFEPEHEPPYLVMERLQGDDLRSLVARKGVLSPAQVRDCAWQCVCGLAAAHSAGILHRDIKPSNIMLCAGGVYKLLDFGLASSHEGDLTASGEIVGTQRYVAPERMSGADTIPGSDLWALGVVLCELATGRHPFAARGPADPAALPPGQPADFAAWISRLIEPDPARRFADGAAALEALGHPAPARRDATASTVVGDDPTHPLPANQKGASGTRPVIMATSRPPPSTPGTALTTVVKAPRPRLPLWLKLTAAIWLVSSAGALVAGYAITERAIAAQIASLRTQLLGVAAGAAQLVDPAVQERLAAHPDPAAPELKAMRERLARFADAFPEVHFIYTMAKLPETAQTQVVQFVCDASDEVDRNHDGVIGPDEQRAEIGTRYSAREAPELIRGFEQPGTDDAPTHDQWGWWMSGYAPIRDAEGRSVGLVGVDLPASDIDRLRHGFLSYSAVLLGTTLVAFLAAGMLIAWRMRRPVAELTRGMQAVAGGDLSVEIDVSSRDEFGILAASFRSMRDELRRAAGLRAAFDGFVARTLSDREGRAAATQGEGARLALAVEGCPEAVIAAALAAARQHGGVPEQVGAGGVVMIFPLNHPGDPAQERAVRAALAALPGIAPSRAACGVASGPGSGERAMRLARMGLRLGPDLLVDPSAFAPVSAGFYADLLQERDDASGRVVDEAWAVKGAISG